MSARLKSIKMAGFRSFADEQSVIFPERGLMLLSGFNHDTKGGSGSGKSSVLLGISLGLGYCPFPVTELGTRGSATKLRVELVLDTSEGIASVVRSASPVQMSVAGEPVKGGAKAVEERLAKILGSSPELLSLLCYRQQGERGLFLSKTTNAEKQEILTSLIPQLWKYESVIEPLPAEIREAEKAVEQAYQRWESASQHALKIVVPDVSAVAAERQTLLHRENVTKEEVQKLNQRAGEIRQLISTLKATVSEKYVEELRSAKTKLASLQAPEANKPDPQLERLQQVATNARIRCLALQQEFDLAKADYQEKVRSLHKSVLSSSQKALQAPGLLREKKRIEEHLASVQAKKCPTCLRSWEEGDGHISELTASLNKLNGQILECEEAEKTAASFQKEVDDLKAPEPNPALAKFSEARLKVEEQMKSMRSQRQANEELARKEFANQVAEARQAVQAIENAQKSEELAKTETFGNELTLVMDKVQANGIFLKDLEIRKVQIGALIEQARSRAAEFKEAKREEEKADDVRTKAQETLKEKKDLLALFGREGFLGVIFNEILDEISTEANKILGSIANTRNCTIEFKSQPLTAKGSIKHQIVPVISIDGHEASSLRAGTSGGMQSSIELAVDLALGRVVAAREGISPGWLVLDECFQGLGPVEMESCLEILQLYAQDRLVLVVEHMSEFKSMFTKVINVSYKNGISTIEE